MISPKLVVSSPDGLVDLLLALHILWHLQDAARHLAGVQVGVYSQGILCGHHIQQELLNARLAILCHPDINLRKRPINVNKITHIHDGELVVATL